MNFSVWWNKKWHDKSWPSGAMEMSFREVAEDSWNAALKFAQQPQGEICRTCRGTGHYMGLCKPCGGSGKLSPHAADVVGNLPQE